MKVRLLKEWAILISRRTNTGIDKVGTVLVSTAEYGAETIDPAFTGPQAYLVRELANRLSDRATSSKLPLPGLNADLTTIGSSNVMPVPFDFGTPREAAV